MKYQICKRCYGSGIDPIFSEKCLRCNGEGVIEDYYQEPPKLTPVRSYDDYINDLSIEDALRAELEEWKADAERLGLALNEELYGLPMSEDIQKAQEAMRLHIALVEKEKSK